MVCVFFMANNEWIAIVIIITIPPNIVWVEGCSLIISQTHIGPIIVSKRKKRLTSAAVINRGAIVTKTNGIATHITHIIGIKIISVPISVKSLTKKKANIATHNLPITAEGTKSVDFAYLAKLALQACNANLARYAKSTDLVPSAVIGKLCVAIFAFFFVKDFTLIGTDMIFIPIMCVMCVAIPFVLVTIAPRFITAAEVNLFFLLETIIGPIWVWLIIKEQPSTQTILGGIVIIITIAIHSLLAIKKTQTKTT